jgi:hypothetical protein
MFDTTDPLPPGPPIIGKPKKKKAQKPKAKPAKKRKPAKPPKAKTKPTKAKKAPAKKAKAAKKPAGKSKAPKNKATGPDRCERLDLRLTKAEKAKVLAKAKKSRRTVTSLLREWVEKLR